MLLLGALLVLLTAGLWVYGLIDLLLTPATDCRHLRKGAWLAIAGLLFVPGAVAWLWFGRPLAAAAAAAGRGSQLTLPGSTGSRRARLDRTPMRRCAGTRLGGHFRTGPPSPGRTR